MSTVQSTLHALRPRPLYRELASLVQARHNCLSGLKAGTLPNPWVARHEETIERLVKEYMPSGSGFDSGTKIDLERSRAGKLVFTTAFHHMDENGYYDGWTEHRITVTPSFDGFNLRIGGRNRRDIKEYMYQTFDECLNTDLAYAFEWDRLSEKYNVKLVSRWIDQCYQRWDVQSNLYSENPPELVTADHRSWTDARDTAVEIMREWESKGREVKA
jgi:hypothetical protein